MDASGAGVKHVKSRQSSRQFFHQRPYNERTNWQAFLTGDHSTQKPITLLLLRLRTTRTNDNTQRKKAQNNLTFGVRVKTATHMQLRWDDRVLSARSRLLERAISKDRFVCLSVRPSRGVYTIQTLEQMLHEKSWRKDFSQSWGNLSQVNFPTYHIKCHSKCYWIIVMLNTI